MSKTIAVVSCGCQNEFQDRNYGPTRRVANLTQKTSPKDTKVVRCTGCGREHRVNEASLKG